MWFLFSCTKEQEVGLMTVQSMWPSTRYTHIAIHSGNWILFPTHETNYPMDALYSSIFNKHVNHSKYGLHSFLFPSLYRLLPTRSKDTPPLSLPPFFPPSSQLASSNNNSDLSTAVITGWWHVKKEVLASYGNSEN